MGVGVGVWVGGSGEVGGQGVGVGVGECTILVGGNSIIIIFFTISRNEIM